MSLSIAPITQGFDFNFFQVITVSNGSFNHLSDLLIPFSTYTVTFQLYTGSSKVEYSFNGNTLHGNMIDGYASNNLVFQNRVISGIWFRSSGTGTVRVEAWATR